MKKSQVLHNKGVFDLAIATGASGSAIYPGIAIARELQGRISCASPMFLGTATGLAAHVANHEHVAFHAFDLQDSATAASWNSLKKSIYLFCAIRQARRFFKASRPHLVLGLGGLFSASVIYAAYLLHIPTILLEPNYKAGLENQLLGKAVDHIALGFAETASAFPPKKTSITGIPIRKAFSFIGTIPPPDKGEKYNIAIISGNGGSQSINRAVVEALDNLLPHRSRLAFTHQTGQNENSSLKCAYADKGFRADVLTYIDDLPKIYAKAHLLICRAGASTVAELQASRRPGFIIAADPINAQKKWNAYALNENASIEIIPEASLSGTRVSNAIKRVIETPESFPQVWLSPLEKKKQTAAAHLVDICLRLSDKRTLGASMKDSYDQA